MMFRYSFLVVVLSSLLYAQSGPTVLRHNAVEFSGGTIISDLKPEDLSTEVPRTIDFDEYMNYLFSQQIVVPGTININIGPSKRMITGRFYGTMLTPTPQYFQGVRGISPVDLKLGTNTTDPNAWSHIQVGTSNYGSSIWMQLNEDGDAMELSAYKNIQRDTLEPINPQRLGLQLKDTGSSDVLIHEKLTIREGKVGIATANPTEALEVWGNVTLGGNKLLGKVGEVRSASAATTVGDISAVDTVLATFTFSGADVFTADLTVLAMGTITHNLDGYESMTISQLRVKDLSTGGTIIATSEPLTFDFQNDGNEEVTYNHFLIFDVEAGHSYSFEILGRKDFAPNVNGDTLTSTGQETYSNKRILLYAIPAN